MKPTIEEVREHFENAAEVECLEDGKIYDLSKLEITEDYHFFFNDVWLEVLHKFKEIKIWSEKQGYAKIITYKNKNMEITEQQIKDLESGIVKVKELFPDVFKEKIESGFWYKHEKSGCLAFVCEVVNFDFVGYGFNHKKNWVDKKDSWTAMLDTWKLATNEEVEIALTLEAVKRGYKKGDIVTVLDSISEKKIVQDGEYVHGYDEVRKNYLFFGGVLIFKNGIWAEIIPQEEKLYTEKDLVDFGNKVLQDAQNDIYSQIENFKLNR